MALEQMEGFELAGRTVSKLCRFQTATNIHHFLWQLRVNTVHEKGTVRYTQQDSLDEAGGMPFCLFIMHLSNFKTHRW